MNNNEKKARLIAFYLPQFYPISENDKWWGKGFTEWTNVTKAKPLFKGHKQPLLPADLGFYDLRVPETRDAQAELAAKYGIDGFCYWHYWFGNGKRILERPFNEVLHSGKPDYPFCLGWANQTWSGVWHSAPNRILIEQKYPGKKDFEAHFYSILEAFQDKRYMSVDGKKIFLIYDPSNLPDAKAFTDQWRDLAAREGIKGLHFIAHNVTSNPEKYGCDACVDNAPFLRTPLFSRGQIMTTINKITSRHRLPKIYSYADCVRYINNISLSDNQYSLVIPGWDNTPRSGIKGVVFKGSTPELFKAMLTNAIKKIDNLAEFENRIIFIKAWNEWAEGNYLEPDVKHGQAYLQAVKECITDNSSLE